MGRAADRLNLTPSAVSHGLGRLRWLLNDPLFLRTPKGVVPTARATELGAPIADILARVHSVMATAAPFNPATAVRRFAIGAPDGVSAVILRPLLAKLSRIAPRIATSACVSSCPLRPACGEARLSISRRTPSISRSFRPMTSPPRFEKRCIYEEDFVIAMCLGHPFARDPTLARYCDMQHLVVSHSGDPYGFVDEQLAKRGRARRIALTVPNFMFALAVIAETDLISALPRRFVTMHAARFGS
nr:LysR family transcriptional regulator [Mesorhizobium ciceri]